MPRNRTKEGIMGIALACTGVVDFFESLNGGDNPLKALAGAYSRTEERGEAIKKAGRELRKKKERARGEP